MLNSIKDLWNVIENDPTYDGCAVNEAEVRETQAIDSILYRFYGIRYFPTRADNGMFGWYHITIDSLIPHDQQPELIRRLPIAYTEHEQEDND